MLKKNKIVLSVFMIAFAFSVKAIECKSYKTRHVLNKRFVSKDEVVCISKFGGIAASSKNCSDITDKKCPFNHLVKSKSFENFVSELGSPGFNLCHDLEGSPQIYEIKIRDEWKQFERCYAKKSAEFVDIDRLVLYYKAL